MKTVFTCFAAMLLVAAAASAYADPTPAQRTQVENCKIMSGAVFEFAQARDRKQAKMDAFKDVTHGQTYVPGSLLDETLQWAYAHPDEQPDTASAHFYGRCVLDAYEARNPDTEGELDIAAQGCQQAHSGVPAAIRDCVEDKTQDIITRTQSALASAATPAATTVSPAPTAASLVAMAEVTPPPRPAPAAATALPAPLAKSAVQVPASAAAPQAVAAATSLPAAAHAAIVAPPAAAPAMPAPQPVIASAPIPPAPTPVAAAQAPITPSAPLAAKVPVPQPDVAQAPAPVIPPQPVPVPPPAPIPARTAVTANAVAKAPTPQPAPSVLPPLPGSAAPAAGPPPNLAGFGKLTVGMPMDDAYKAMGSHGDTDWDQQGEVHTYMIGDDHGFIEIRPSSAGTLYSIRVVGGADAHVAPILNVVLGDDAFVLVNNVGLPSSRTPLPGDKELWNYVDRNYAFEISPGGDVIGVRIIDTATAPAAVTGTVTP